MEFLEGIEPRKYQKDISSTCLRKNCLVVLPTGIGKTLIALIVAIERMKKFPGQKVVFLAPTRPLSEQHLKTFKKHLPELFGDLQLFTGKVKAELRKKIWETADIVFSTPQCIANDVKNDLYDFSEVCLLIEDEAHRCVKNYSYNYVAKKYNSQSQNQRILGLTASPGSDSLKIKKICENLFVKDVELRTRESPDVKKYLQELEFSKINVTLPPKFEEIRQALLQLFNKYVEKLRKTGIFYGPASKTNLIKLQKTIGNKLSGKRDFRYMHAASYCASAIKIQHCLELLETQNIFSFKKYLQNLFEQAAKKKSKGVITLVKQSEFNFAHNSANEIIAKKIDHPKIEKLIEIIKSESDKNSELKILIFTQYRESANRIVEKLKKEIPSLNSQIFVGQTMKQGIGMKQEEQKRILQNFSRGKINILCATSIAEEGLDIPEVNAVIFYEPVPSAIRAIQRAGRTARLKKGKLFILVTKKTRDEAYYYVSRSRERKMQSAIEKIKKDLNEKEVQKSL